jgi:hypothetical protein
VALCAQSVNVSYEADFDQFVVNWDKALCPFVLKPLPLFRILNIDAVDAANYFEVG